MTARWYSAARFTDVAESKSVYEAIQAMLTAPERPVDVAGYRFIAEAGYMTVAIIGDSASVLTAEQVAVVASTLSRGERTRLDAGLLDLLFADWASKRGHGGPIIERERNAVGIYEERGLEA